MIGGYIGKAIGCTIRRGSLLNITSTEEIQLPVNVVLVDAPLFNDRYREFNIPAGKATFRKITTGSATARLGGKRPSFRSRTNNTGVFD